MILRMLLAFLNIQCHISVCILVLILHTYHWNIQTYTKHVPFGTVKECWKETVVLYWLRELRVLHYCPCLWTELVPRLVSGEDAMSRLFMSTKNCYHFWDGFSLAKLLPSETFLCFLGVVITIDRNIKSVLCLVQGRWFRWPHRHKHCHAMWLEENNGHWQYELHVSLSA